MMLLIRSTTESLHCLGDRMVRIVLADDHSRHGAVILCPVVDRVPIVVAGGGDSNGLATQFLTAHRAVDHQIVAARLGTGESNLVLLDGLAGRVLVGGLTDDGGVVRRTGRGLLPDVHIGNAGIGGADHSEASAAVEADGIPGRAAVGVVQHGVAAGIDAGIPFRGA